MQPARRRPRSAYNPTAQPAPGSSQQELAVQMHLSICRHWAATLRGPYDWGEHPLGAYLLTDEFLESMSDRAQRPLHRVAWICAMLACGQVRSLRALGVRQRSGDCVCGGGGLVRADGASAWECPLERSCDALRLRYWIHTDGTVEFDALVGAARHSTCMHERPHRRPVKRRP